MGEINQESFDLYDRAYAHNQIFLLYKVVKPFRAGKVIL